MAVVTNYIRNPSIETNVTDWSADGGVTRSRITSDAYVGSAAMQAVIDGGFSTQGVVLAAAARPAAVTGETWTASAYIKSADIVSMRVVIEEYNASNSFLRSTNGSSLALSGTYGRAICTATLGADTASIGIVVRTPSAQAGTAILDAFMLHPGATPIDYFDGDTADGGGFLYDWTGTAHASTSTRTSTGLSAAARMRRANFELRPGY